VTTGAVWSIRITTVAELRPLPGLPCQAVQDALSPAVSAVYVRSTHVPAWMSVADGSDHFTVTGPRYQASQSAGAGSQLTPIGVGAA
jgi:hypothetical protein